MIIISYITISSLVAFSSIHTEAALFLIISMFRKSWAWEVVLQLIEINILSLCDLTYDVVSV